MSESPNRERDRVRYWNEVVVPAARGLESFFWNLVWFAVILCLLFSFNPLPQQPARQ
jgi:hypothetical protein